MKAYPLGIAAKEYVKEEFKRITDHMRYHQKSVNSELAKILKDKEEKETKPAPTTTPVVQPSGSGTSIQVEHDPMNSYNKADWKDCKLTMQTTWIQYLDWKRKIDNHFKYVERLSTTQMERRDLRLQDAMDIHWIKYIDQEIMANNVRDW